MFVIWTIPSAVARNIATLIVTRFFHGFSGSTFLSVSGGTVSDIFPKNKLQKPMVFVALAPFIGPSSGPLIGGFINYYLSWRWTYYIILIWSGVLLIAIIVFVPETYHPVVLKTKARNLRLETDGNSYYAPGEGPVRMDARRVALTLMRPFQLLFLEPMCLCLDIYSALLLGILYLFFTALPQVFRENYDMDLWQCGLTWLGIVAGMLIAGATNPVWVRVRQRLLERSEKTGGEPGRSQPEYQLPPVIAGCVLIPIGLFWFAWTAQPSIHWIVPVIGTMFFGSG